MINRVDFLTNILKYASMVNNTENIIDDMLAYLGITLSSDRSYIFEEVNGTHFDNTYEWCNDGVTPEIDNLQGLPYNIGEIWYKEYDKNNNIMIYDIEEYKNVAPEMYEVLAPQGIKTLVTGPLELNGKYIGFYGVDNPPVENMEDISAIITILSYIISIMISNRDSFNRIKKMSFEDQLTGVYNRHALSLLEDSHDNDNNNTSINLMVCDINGLKKMNDENGHEAGDKLIINTANALAKVFNKNNVYRIGGDEFVVIIKNKSKDDFDKMKEKLQTFLDLWEIKLAMGSVYYPNMKYSIHQMMKDADIEMYKDKSAYYSQSGKDRRTR